MSDQRVHRIVVLGTGTGVGKTRLTRALARALRRSGSALALKPIETGGDADARMFDVENTPTVHPHPLLALDRPISPHLAARLENRHISVGDVVAWVSAQEAALALCDHTSPYVFSLVESAGGALTPLSREARNLDLARALSPDTLLLVGPDSLGVLHAMSSTLIAMTALGCPPDLVALSATHVDASTGTNALELRDLGIADPAFVLGHDADDATPLAEAILKRVSS